MPVRKNGVDYYTVQEYKVLQAKVRKLQKENRDLRAQLVAEIDKHIPDVNAPISTEVDTEGESTTDFNSETEVVDAQEFTAPINSNTGE